jgi:hypothetical protein
MVYCIKIPSESGICKVPEVQIKPRPTDVSSGVAQLPNQAGIAMLCVTFGELPRRFPASRLSDCAPHPLSTSPEHPKDVAFLFRSHWWLGQRARAYSTACSIAIPIPASFNGTPAEPVIRSIAVSTASRESGISCRINKSLNPA